MNTPDSYDRPAPSARAPRRMLIIITGSIAAYKACEVISRLIQVGVEIRVVATANALRMVGTATLEGLTGHPVSSDLWEPGRAMDHIELTRWADLVLVCPATASCLNRLAAGLADDLAGALFLAHDRSKPWLFAPAMNPAMWSHPVTAASVDRLRAVGARFLPVTEGRTACGERGVGRLAEPDEVVAITLAALARPRRKLRILITSGGTEEPIDGVRVVSNRSTGRTGAWIAGWFQNQGHDALLLRARAAAPSPPAVQEETFGSFADLDAALSRILGREPIDAIIHAAAVSDFGVETVQAGGTAHPPGRKLDSRHPITLRLTPHPKLINTLRSRSQNPALRVVAFKLTDHSDPAATAAALQHLWDESAPDLIVHNDLAEQGASFEDFPSRVHRRDGAEPRACATRTELAAALETLLVDPSL